MKANVANLKATFRKYIITNVSLLFSGRFDVVFYNPVKKAIVEQNAFHCYPGFLSFYRIKQHRWFGDSAIEPFSESGFRRRVFEYMIEPHSCVEESEEFPVGFLFELISDFCGKCAVTLNFFGWVNFYLLFSEQNFVVLQIFCCFA